jgi:hypothetical protein
MLHRTLDPGQPGTKKFQKEYGGKLLYVRYQYDSEKKQTVKTVEIIVEKQNWQPPKNKLPPNKKVYIGIKYAEIDLARMAKSLGGRWNRQKQLWELPYRQVKIPGLEERIVEVD